MVHTGDKGTGEKYYEMLHTGEKDSEMVHTIVQQERMVVNQFT